MRSTNASALTSTELRRSVDSPAGLNQAAPASVTVATAAPPVSTASRPTSTGSTLPAYACAPLEIAANTRQVRAICTIELHASASLRRDLRLWLYRIPMKGSKSAQGRDAESSGSYSARVGDDHAYTKLDVARLESAAQINSAS